MSSKVIVDNTILSNFASVEKLHLLKKAFSEPLVIAREVKEEYQVGVRKRIIPDCDLSWLEEVHCVTDVEKEQFSLMRSKLANGEASSIAIALCRNYKLLTDDLDARRTAQRKGINVSGTIGVLANLVQNDLLGLEEANHLLRAMINKGFFSPVSILDDCLS